MRGSSPAAALNAYLEIVERVVSCVTRTTVLATGRRPAPLPWDLLLNRGTPASLRGGLLNTAIQLDQRYIVTEDPAAGARERWRVAIVAYRYTLSEQGTRRELFAFHWHPGVEQVSIPHVHPGSRILSVPSLTNVHVPTGALTAADMVWFAIHELGVAPERADWEQVLAVAGVALAE